MEGRVSWRSALLHAWHSFPIYNQHVLTSGSSNSVGLTSPARLQGWTCDLDQTISIFHPLGQDVYLCVGYVTQARAMRLSSGTFAGLTGKEICLGWELPAEWLIWAWRSQGQLPGQTLPAKEDRQETRSRPETYRPMDVVGAYTPSHT